MRYTIQVVTWTHHEASLSAWKLTSNTTQEYLHAMSKSLCQYILTTLQIHLDLHSLASQGYDGASVMSGRCSGVQQRIMEVAPQAIYIHCFAHILNLVLVDCCIMCF